MRRAPAGTYFVTASGTGIGKTFVSVLLIAQLRQRGRAVRALKPVATGFGADPDATDSGLLLRALGLERTPENISRITPWAYAAPLSPDMAAAREGRAVPFDELIELCASRPPGSEGSVTLVEGIGGVMTPLDERHTVLDWIAALGAPPLLVTGSYLGSLSHTLTAAGMLAARGCPPAAVIVNESPGQPVPTEETAAALGRFMAGTPVHVLPRLPRADTDLAPDMASWLALP
jgi:dethiobiotin synthetase